MKIKLPFAAALVLGSGLLPSNVNAAFTLIDDLTTGHSLGELVGQTANGSGGTWQGVGALGAVSIGTAASGGQAAVTSTTAGGGAAYINLPTPIGASSAAATIFFQFDMGSTQTGNNVNWSLENVGTATDSGGASANNVIELNANVPGRVGVTIRNGGAFNEMSADGTSVFAPQSSTLYNIWYLVNNSAKTYEVYMSGGLLGSTPIHMQISTGAYSATPTFSGNFTGAFRNATASTAVNSFIFGPGGGANPGAPSLVSLWQDSTGFNTINPVAAVPEPASTSVALALGIGMVAFLHHRRRRC